MASRVAAWILTWGALSALAGCGKSEGGAQPIPQGELPARIAALLCDSMAKCCRAGDYSFNLSACKAEYVEELADELSENDPSRVAYDEKAAGECLAAVAPNIECGEVDEDDAAPCQRIFRGRVGAGQPCNESQECADVGGKSAECFSEDGLTQAVCVAANSDTAARRGKAGEACVGTCFEDESCDFVVAAPAPGPGVPAPQPDAICYRDDGLACNMGVCSPLAEVGEPCNDYAACRGTAFCDYQVQLCSAPRANGEPCQSNDECQSDSCLYSEYPTDPSLPAPVAVCGSRETVTAEQCANDFTDEPPDSTDPGGDPGQPAPTP